MSAFAMAINAGNLSRASLNVASGAIPLLGGILAAFASAWGEQEQEQVNDFLRHWLRMLEDEIREKGVTIAEIISRLDMSDEDTLKRVESPEYQALLKKSFRKWSSIDSESKRTKIRNILANAAATRYVSDDVVSLFIDWLDTYSDLHFKVISQIYNNEGATRGGVWRALERPRVAETSADADLYKMLYRDLSTGSVIRQVRQTDYFGNYIKKETVKASKGQGSKTMVSAFDENEGYELTELGKQFVHYAMNELSPRITFDDETVSDG